MKRILLIFTFLLLFRSTGICGAEDHNGLSQRMLNGRSFGIQTGTGYAQIDESNLPDSRTIYYNSVPHLAALTENKIDGSPIDKPVFQNIIGENKKAAYIPEKLNPFVSAIRSKDTEGELDNENDPSGQKPGPEHGENRTAVPEYKDFSELSGKTISMLTGAPFEELVRSKVPDVGAFTYFSNITDIILALKSGKTDACLNNNAIAQLAVNHDPEIALFPQNLQEGTFGFAFAKGDPNRDKWSSAFDTIDKNMIRSVWEKWTGTDDSVKIIPKQDWPGLNGTVRAAVVDTVEPMSYTGQNGELMGFDIELILLMAKELDVHVEFIGMELSSILASVQSGKALLGAGSIIISDERKEAVDFVEYFPAAFVLVVRSVQDQAVNPADAETAPSGMFLNDLDGKRIGVQMGTIFDKIISEKIPNAEILYFNNFPDELTALGADKVDGVPTTEMIFSQFQKQNAEYTIIDGVLGYIPTAFVFPKTDKGALLQSQMNEFLKELRENGELTRMKTVWAGTNESQKKMTDYKSLPDINGRLNFVTEGDYPPFDYVRDGMTVGYDVEIAALFCEKYGYALDVDIMNFSALMPAVQSGKYDFAASGIAITDERKEMVYFSDPNIEDGIVVMVKVRKDTGILSSMWKSISDSFERTFLREDRYKLFGQGVLTTLLLTVLSVLFGTVLGFIIFMLCRNGNPLANGITNVCFFLVQGMPGVVLLMILYYVIFGSTDISGMTIAVIGFSLIFGAAVFGLLKLGVGAIDRGQYEAAYALGFSDLRAFFKIILPQVIPHVMGAYKGEITSLLKGTAIVGYIAVQDLTKMGDIVRSRTYEAFFPLIAVTVIYFVLEAILGFLIGKISLQIDPKRRNRKSILRGIRTND